MPLIRNSKYIFEEMYSNAAFKKNQHNVDNEQIRQVTKY